MAIPVPQRFRTDVVRRIGRGGEATVYELTGGRALRVFHGAPHGADRRRALASYIDAATEIASLPLPERRFGEFLRDDDSIKAETWSAYLLARMQRSLVAAPWLAADVPGLDAMVAALEVRLRALTTS